MATTDDDRGAPGPVLLTNRDIGEANRSRVLRAFCDHGPLSRADLARLAGVPRATIGVIVQGLIDDALLEESEPDRTTRRVGKPGRPLWFRRDAGLSGAVDFSASSVRAALVNARGELVDRAAVPCETGTASNAELEEAVVSAARSVLGAGDGPILGIGIAVPGVCDARTGTVMGSNQLPGAVGQGLVAAVGAAFVLPVLVDNDARAQALGEKWFGDGRGCTTFASVQTGHGLGVGLVLGGLLYRGDDGMTGELGHTCVDPDGETCMCGLRGCWETIATLRWLRREAAARGLPDAENMDSRLLVALADGKPAAAELLDEYADNLSIGLANLIQLINPARLLLHGDVVGGGEAMCERILARVRARVLPHLRDSLDIAPSTLDQDAGLLGAAGLVLSETFTLAV